MTSEKNLIFYTHPKKRDKKVNVSMECYFELPNTATMCSLQRPSGCLKTARWDLLEDEVNQICCSISYVNVSV